jgi:glutathione S-transferase
MAEYIEVDEAIVRRGLRVVVGQGRPGPWSEAAKGILYVKKIRFVRVRQEDAPSPNLAVLRWTGQTSAPVLVYEDERPRIIWIDQLFLMERLEPTPPLVPARIEDRALMFGLSNELCGENGFGWSRRMMLMHTSITTAMTEAAKSAAIVFGNKYGYSPQAAAAAPTRVAEILRALSEQLDAQRRRGSRFFIGNSLSALDIYWAAFAALIQPLPDDMCPTDPEWRRRVTNTDPVVQAAVVPALMEHRDFIYREFLELPVDLWPTKSSG